jgi:hypothetical protein
MARLGKTERQDRQRQIPSPESQSLRSEKEWHMTYEGNLVVVFISQGPLAAEVAKSKLEAQGIPVMLRYQAIGRVLGLTVDGLGKVEVLVAPEHEAVAREVLEEVQGEPSDEEE